MGNILCAIPFFHALTPLQNLLASVHSLVPSGRWYFPPKILVVICGHNSWKERILPGKYWKWNHYNTCCCTVCHGVLPSQFAICSAGDSNSPVTSMTHSGAFLPHGCGGKACEGRYHPKQKQRGRHANPVCEVE